jgi:hypothetical protein
MLPSQQPHTNLTSQLLPASGPSQRVRPPAEPTDFPVAEPGAEHHWCPQAEILGFESHRADRCAAQHIH